MKPVGDEDLTLYYYSEVPNPQEIERQLESSPELRQRYQQICQLLDTVAEYQVPERHPAYGSRVWHRISPQIDGALKPARRLSWLESSRRWAWAAALLLLLAGAFLVGRMSPRTEKSDIGARADAGQERIVLMTVAGHLERSEMLLLELVNAQEGEEVDLTVERQLARELGDESRLYRQAARQVGQSDVAALLEQLEMVLLELSQGPARVSADDLGQIRLRLDDGDVLFKVRVLGSRIRQEARSGDTEHHQGDEPREI
jgi:hypothetical protein